MKPLMKIAYIFSFGSTIAMLSFLGSGYVWGFIVMYPAAFISLLCCGILAKRLS